MGQNVNIYFIVVLVILAAFTAWGYWRGFIRVAFSLAAVLIMTVLVSWLAPYMNQFLQEHTPLQERITEKCVATIQEMSQDTIQSEAEERLDGANSQGISLPGQWSEQLAQMAAGAMDDALAGSGIYQQVGAYLADLILRGISFGLTFLLVGLILKIIIRLLDVVARLPVLKGINRFFGAAAGLVEGLLVVWVLLFVVTLACTSSWGQQAMAGIRQSEFLSFLYHYNGIVYLVGRVFG